MRRVAIKIHTNAAINRKRELDVLKSRANDIEARLRALRKRIGEIESRVTSFAFMAMVDPAKCIACGTCQDFCPTEAISIDRIASVDPARCIGCGHCVGGCSQGAIGLHPVKRSYEKRAHTAV